MKSSNRRRRIQDGRHLTIRTACNAQRVFFRWFVFLLRDIFKVVPGVCGLTLLSKWRYLSLILNQLTVNCRAGSLVKSTTLLYLSLSTRALIGQFCRPYSPLRPAVRPAKFENLVQHFVANMSREEKFDTYLKELRTNREKQQKPEESMPNFQIDFLQLLEEG